MPLIGVLLLLGFYLTSADFLAGFGVFYLFGSICAGVLSGISIFVLFLLRLKRPQADFVWKIGLTKLSALLVFSFILAGLCMLVGSNLVLKSNYDVTITNHSSAALTGIILTDSNNNTYDFGAVSAGQTLKKNFQFKGEGSVSVKINSIQKESVAFGYITDGMTGDVVITVDKTGQMAAEERLLEKKTK